MDMFLQSTFFNAHTFPEALVACNYCGQKHFSQFCDRIDTAALLIEPLCPTLFFLPCSHIIVSPLVIPCNFCVNSQYTTNDCRAQAGVLGHRHR